MSKLPNHQDHQNNTFYAVDLVSKQLSEDAKIANIDRFLDYYRNMSFKNLIIVPAPISILNHLIVCYMEKEYIYECLIFFFFLRAKMMMLIALQ